MLYQSQARNAAFQLSLGLCNSKYVRHLIITISYFQDSKAERTGKKFIKCETTIRIGASRRGEGVLKTTGRSVLFFFQGSRAAKGKGVMKYLTGALRLVS